MTIQESILKIQHQLNCILQNLSDQDYARPLDAFNGSSIGKHVRHIFDFYSCIIQAVESSSIDYNCRDRSPFLETSIIAAKTGFCQLVDEISHSDCDKIIQVSTDFSSDKDENRPVVQSSIGRELMYAFDHAIHHIAIIKMGMKASMPSIHIPDHIGVAPSTIKYQSKN